MYILFSFWAAKEEGTPIYHTHTQTHTHTHTHKHTHIRTSSYFSSKDHNLAIERDYEFSNQQRHGIILQWVVVFYCTRWIPTIIPSTVEDVFCVDYPPKEKANSCKKQKAYERKNTARFITTSNDVGYYLFRVVHSKKRTKLGIWLKTRSCI